MRSLTHALLGAGLLAAPASARSEDSQHTPPDSAVDLTTSDKSQYTFWNPTPTRLLREMEALYKSPYTVDAGHVQTETYVVGYAYGRDTAGGADIRTETWHIAPTTLKIGLLNNLDLELELAPYPRVRTVDRVARTVTIQNGFGDLQPKAKINLWGNDSGSTAVALLPFVKFPTSQDRLGNHAIEGGLAVPISVELLWGWWLGLSPEVSFLKDANGGGYSPAYADTGYVWHDIAGKLSG